MPLKFQIKILSVDTGNFYYDDEAELHKRNQYVRTERRRLINGFNKKDENENIHYKGSKELLKELEKVGITEKEANKICKAGTLESLDYDEAIKKLLLLYSERRKKIIEYADEAKHTKDELLRLFQDRFDINEQLPDELKNLRILKEESLLDKNGNLKKDNVISVFDSFFTRTIGATQDQLCEDFMVVKVYYFTVLKDIMFHGFYYKGEKYRYFTSSAGQIRTKKCVFIKESVWNKYEKTLMCGLTLDAINTKGGNNPCKHLAYLALTNSATDEWIGFDIDKTIVVDDFETCVNGDVDFIDDKTYTITRNNMDVPVPHMDGCGIILPDAFGEKQVNKMVRSAWIKGLLAVFDFRKFIEVHNCSPIVKDIYGQEHDVISEDIQVILTKSQFKLHSMYDDWQQYKEYFKKYNCTANYTNPEQKRIKNATINYQMLQTLVDITEDEMISIANDSNKRIQNICSSFDSIKHLLGITPYNTNQTSFQEAVNLYPNLINDFSTKRKIRDVKNSLLKRYRSGKLNVHCKYTFILPDLYAFCEWLFLHEENPKGLLEDGEVFCWLFRMNEEVDCLRSPHLDMAHCIRNNVACKKYGNERKELLREWFISNGIYTSTHDLISKSLQ